jgi:hypothetical protein
MTDMKTPERITLRVRYLGTDAMNFLFDPSAPETGFIREDLYDQLRAELEICCKLLQKETVERDKLVAEVERLREAFAASQETAMNLRDEQEVQGECVCIRYWHQETTESGGWRYTDPMTRATAERLLDTDVYEDGTIVPLTITKQGEG